MIVVQLWVGVVFLILAGLLATYNLQRYVSGRYFAERHSEGATKALLGLIRWLWAIIWAGSASMFFFGAFWLIKYTLSQ